jgi:hypothetical protein
LLVNAWRSMQMSPDAMAEAASWPVSEADLHARHLALLKWKHENNLERLMGDPRWHDPEMAGWWVWGQCSWIGSGWCSGVGPWVVGSDGRITKRAEQREEPGVHRKRPHIGNDGRGVNHAQAREPGVGDFHPMTMPELRRWFAFLSARLRHVRIINGAWERACTRGAWRSLPVGKGDGFAGVFLDPPYFVKNNRASDLYAHDDGDNVAAAVQMWCIENTGENELRIVLAGFDGEHDVLVEQHGWRVVEWFRGGFLKGGMGNISKTGEHQQKKERLWLSPSCLGSKRPAQASLFGAR